MCQLSGEPSGGGLTQGDTLFLSTFLRFHREEGGEQGRTNCPPRFPRQHEHARQPPGSPTNTPCSPRPVSTAQSFPRREASPSFRDYAERTVTEDCCSVCCAVSDCSVSTEVAQCLLKSNCQQRQRVDCPVLGLPEERRLSPCAN